MKYPHPNGAFKDNDDISNKTLRFERKEPKKKNSSQFSSLQSLVALHIFVKTPKQNRNDGFSQSVDIITNHREKKEMVPAQLLRFNLSFFTRPPLSLHTHFTLLPKHRLNLSAPKSTLATTEPIPISHVSEPESHVTLSLDKLFVPPETEVSVDDSSLSTRILKGSNIVLSKYARDAQVTQAEFVKSSVRTEDCPSDGLPEFALVGRSNVGKSSLLNSLVRRKKLALTSKKPGTFFFIAVSFLR